VFDYRGGKKKGGEVTLPTLYVAIMHLQVKRVLKKEILQAVKQTDEVWSQYLKLETCASSLTIVYRTTSHTDL
jgi:hypothetical protein